MDWAKEVAYAVLNKKQQPSDVLSKIINDNQYETFLEVGSWEGKNMKRIVNNSPGLIKTWCIDPYKAIKTKDPSHIYQESQTHFDKTFEEAKRRNPTTIFIKDTSVRSAKLFKDESIDIVFIDAEHTYTALKQDLYAWLPKVKRGGTLSGHDFGPRFNCIIKAVIEEFGTKFTLHNGKVWSYKKKK